MKTEITIGVNDIVEMDTEGEYQVTQIEEPRSEQYLITLERKFAKPKTLNVIKDQLRRPGPPPVDIFLVWDVEYDENPGLLSVHLTLDAAEAHVPTYPERIGYDGALTLFDKEYVKVYRKNNTYMTHAIEQRTVIA